MAHMGDGTEDTELGRGRKRRNLKNARPTGKARRRRLDEEDEQMEEVRIAKRRKRGVLWPLLCEVDHSAAQDSQLVHEVFTWIWQRLWAVALATKIQDRCWTLDLCLTHKHVGTTAVSGLMADTIAFHPYI